MRYLGNLLFISLLLTCVTGWGGGLPGEIEVGDTRDHVLEVLGEPNGSVQFGAVEVLFYERGQVDLQDGKVIKERILTQGAFEAQQQARAKAQERADAEAERAEAARQASKASRAETRDQQQKDAERAAALEQRIAEGISQPPTQMSSRKARKYRRGRSASQIEQRKQQIIDAFEAEAQ